MRYSYYNSKINHAIAQQASLVMAEKNLPKSIVATKKMSKDNLITSACKIAQSNTTYLKECELYGVSRDVLVNNFKKHGLYERLLEQLKEKHNKSKKKKAAK